jgi:MYXO-CTERM domain-containing protein
MSTSRSRGSVALAAMLSLAVASHSLADVVIGDWENATDGWIDWGTQAAIDPGGAKYAYSTFGATHGTSAIKITQTSYNQNLSIKLQNTPGLKDAFFANQQLSIDFTVPASAVNGYAQVYDIALNAETYGFHSVGPVPKHTFGFANGNAQTTTLTWDYSTLVDGITTNGEILPASGWVEFILATNSDADHGTFYFDNARLGPSVAKGDFNLSGALDGGDMDILFAAEQGEVGPVDGKYDMNADGFVVTTVGTGIAASDTDYWVLNLAHTRYGDANVDKKVDFADLVVLAQNYNASPSATWAMGSFNGDGAVNFADLVVLAQNYNFGAVTDLSGLESGFAADWALAQSLVPEPASLGLLVLAAPVLRRRR